MSQALVLFAHGARDPEWALPLRRVQAAVAALDPTLPVECAFLEFMTPTLADAIAALALAGAKRIVVLPMFIAQGGHLKRDLPLLLDQLRQRHPTLELRLAAAVGESDAVVQAMAGEALRQALAG